jgi:hypothetical protein
MKKFFFTPIFLISLICSATQYYVNNKGKDTNTGLSEVQAWAHHPWMANWTGSVILEAGDIIKMKRGDVWTISGPVGPFMTVTQSGTSGHPIITTVYGSGNKPIINISSDNSYAVIRISGKSYLTFDNLDISHFSSKRNEDNFQDGIKFDKDKDNNVPHDLTITNCDIHNIPRFGIMGGDDSYNILIGDTTITSYATSESYCNQIYDCGCNGIILCGCDPVTNHSHWNVYYNFIHDINYAGGNLESIGITFTSETVGKGQGYSTGWPSYCVARYNRIANIPGRTGIDCHGGTHIYIQDNYIYNCWHGIILQATDRVYAQTAILDSAFIERNTIENPGNSPYGHFSFVFLLAENVSHRATNCFIRDNTLFYTNRPSGESEALGICLYNVDGAIIEGNKLYNGPIGAATGGIYIGSGTGNNVKNIKIRNNWIYNWDRSIAIAIGSIDGDLTFHNNVIYSNGRPFVGEGGTISNNITINNNTFLSISAAPKPYVIDFVANGAVTIAIGASLTIKNNIVGFASNSSEGMYIYAPNAINGTMTINNNIYWNSLYDNPFNIEASYHNWADWNALGYDVHSIYNTDPLFRNGSGSYSDALDFVLEMGSPAINAGADVGLQSDFFGNPISGLPDIGAIETPAIPTGYDDQIVKISPNPAHTFFNIRIDETTHVFDYLKIIDYLGKMVFQIKVNPNVRDIQIPIKLLQGMYIVQMGSGNSVLLTQKLVIIN